MGTVDKNAAHPEGTKSCTMADKRQVVPHLNILLALKEYRKVMKDW
jgi:hypothetical protein